MEKHNKGFTLVEMLVVLTLLSMVMTILLGTVSFSGQAARNNANKIVCDFTSIETAAGQYVSDFNAYPTGLTDATFVPKYLFAPSVPTGWDATYGTNGYSYGQQSGQPSPNNGYYVCAHVHVTGANDTGWQSATLIGQQLPVTKYYYNTSCMAVSNMAAPGGAADVYITMWLTRS